MRASHGSGIRYPKPEILRRIDLARHTIIEASAGTGKTHTLEHLVLDLLLTTDVDLESILVVTYTERAAAELRARLRAKLLRLSFPNEGEGAQAQPEAPGVSDEAWWIDESARRKLRRTLASFDSASISTIHAFCQRMLRENAFASKRLFEQELIDGRIAFSRAFRSALRRTLAREPSYRLHLEEWLSRESLDALEAILHECHHRRGTFDPPYVPERIEARAASFAGIDVAADRILAELKRAGVHANAARAIAQRCETLRALLDAHAGQPNMPRFLALLSEQDRRGKEGLLEFILFRTEGKSLGDPPVLALVESIRELWGVLPSFESATVQLFLPVVEREMRREKSKTGRIDFDDMLTLLWESLAGPSGAALASAIRARYRFALVDEFQDTDDVQWRVFDEIFLTRGNSRLFVIGDPKQSIYGFRGADVLTYLSAADRILEHGGNKVTLSENRRSTPALVRALNNIFDQGAESPFFSGGIRYDSPVTSALMPRADLLGGPPIRLLRIASVSGRLGSHVARGMLGYRIAREMGALLAPDREPEIAPSDIFVLTRTTRECAEIGQHLRRFGVPYAFYKEEGLFQTAEAEHIHALLAAIADPHRQSRRIRAWLGPFFAVPLDRIPLCADLPGSHPLISRLFDWKSLADRKAYDRFFTAIVEESGIIRRELFFKGSERELTNYLHIFEVLLQEANRSRSTLDEIVHVLSSFIEGRRLPEGEDGNIQRLESDRSAVQIMTMHKAKGLEARVVFVFGGFEGTNTNVHVYHRGCERMLAIGRHKTEAVEREKAEEDERLLYVALTRAKERLYLPYFGAPIGEGEERGSTRGSRPVTGCYRRLNEVLERIARAGVGPGTADLFSIEDVPLEETAEASESVEPEPLSWALPDSLFREPEVAPDIARLRHDYRGLVVTSYSRIKTAAGGYRAPSPAEEALSTSGEARWRSEPRLLVGGPADDLALEVGALEGDLENAAGLEPPGGPSSGRCLHEILERIELADLLEAPSFEFWSARKDVRDLFLSALRRHDLDPRFLRATQEIVHAALTIPIRAGDLVLDRGFASAPRSVREMEFLYPADTRVKRETLIKGFIDLVFEHEGRTYFLDWKSDLLASYAADALEVHMAQNYTLQTELYSIALIRMLGLRDRREYDRRFGGSFYCFVRGMARAPMRPMGRGPSSSHRPTEGVVFTRLSWREALEAERRISGRSVVAQEKPPEDRTR